MRAAAAFGLAALWACDTSPPPPPRQRAVAALGGGAVAGTVRVSGSSALEPLVNAAKERFEVAHPGVSVELSAGGSKKGLNDVAAGAVDVGDSDLFAPPDLEGVLVDHKVAAVAFAPMAHRGPETAGVVALSRERLAAAFSGAVTSWAELGGADVPVVVINRAPGSGTRAAFGRALFGGGGDRFVEAQTEDNSGALVAKLKQTRGAISYLSTSFADPALAVIGLRGPGGEVVTPAAEAVATGAWPAWSYEHMYTRGEPRGAVKAFVDYVLSPAFQEEVVPKLGGFVPITRMRVAHGPEAER
jgi:phosphate transport system substrate-binding protein